MTLTTSYCCEHCGVAGRYEEFVNLHFFDEAHLACPKCALDQEEIYVKGRLALPDLPEDHRGFLENSLLRLKLRREQLGIQIPAKDYLVILGLLIGSDDSVNKRAKIRQDKKNNA